MTTRLRPGPIVLAVWLLACVTPAAAQTDTVWVRRLSGTGNGDDGVRALAVGPDNSVYALVQNRPSDSAVAIITAKYSSSGQLLWSQRFEGDGYVIPADIAVDASGNAFVTGSARRPDRWYDMVTLKYTASGDSCWVRYFDAEGNNDEASTVVVDGEGSAYVVGYGESNHRYEDMALVKYSSSGEELWAQLYDFQENEDFGLAAAIDSQGYVYEVGLVCNWQGAGDYDMQVLKYSPQGALVWARTFAGPGDNDDSATCVAVDPQNNVVVAGCTHPDIWNSGYLVVKYTPAGETLWSRSYISNGEENGAVAVETDNQGNVILAANDDDHFEYDYLVVKYSPTGDELWCRRYNTEEDYYEELVGMQLDAEGNIYLTGTSEAPGAGEDEEVATIKYSPSGESLWARRWEEMPALGAGLALTPAGPCIGVNYRHWGRDSNALLLQYDSSGNELWEQRLAGPGQRCGGGADDVVFDPEGNVIAVGHLEMTGEGLDLATAKYSPAGELLWLQTYHNLECHEDAAIAVAIDSWGSVYVTGKSEGDGTGFDYVTLKYSATGGLLWFRRYDGPAHDDDVPVGLAVDRSGNVAVTGQSYGNGTERDYATVRYSSSGRELWVRRYNGSENLRDNAVDVAVNREGATYVSGTSREAGSTYSATTIMYDMSGTVMWTSYIPVGFIVEGMGLDPEGFCFLGGQGASGFVGAKLNPSGETLWVRRADMPDGFDARAAKATEDGRLCVTGYAVSGGDPTYMTVAFGSDGEEIWRQDYGYGVAYDIVSAADGMVFVTGRSYGTFVTLGYDSSGSQVWLDCRGGGTGNALSWHAGRLAVVGAGFTTIVYEPQIGLAEPSSGIVMSPAVRAHPNPFCSSVRFTVRRHPAGRTGLDIYDRSGRHVRTLQSETDKRGDLGFVWNGTDVSGKLVPAGVYFCTLGVEGRRVTCKVVLTRTAE